MNKPLSIGSIIEVGSIKMCILAYSITVNNNKILKGYYAIPYPIGFTSVGDVVFVATDSIGEICFEGYRDDVCEEYLSDCDALFEKFIDSDPAVIKETMNLIKMIGEREK